MKYTYTIFTKVLAETEYKNWLSEIIEILKNNDIHEVEILFGVAWGNEYKDWTPFKVDVEEIVNEIKEAEKMNVGRFSHDDFFIMVSEIEVEILFCHECDMHLSFNDQNRVVSAIINEWEINRIIHVRKENDLSV